MTQPATLTPPTRRKRYTQLHNMSRAALAALYRQTSGYVGGLHPPEKWSKDDLVTAVLDVERYPLGWDSRPVATS